MFRRPVILCQPLIHNHDVELTGSEQPGSISDLLVPKQTLTIHEDKQTNLPTLTN